VKILLLPGLALFTLFISFSLSCCASGQALIQLGIQGRFDEKKRSKEKSSPEGRNILTRRVSPWSIDKNDTTLSVLLPFLATILAKSIQPEICNRISITG